MEEYRLTIEPVPHDDHGDDNFKWYAHFRRGENQYWHDYFADKPTFFYCLGEILKTNKKPSKSWGHEKLDESINQ